MPRVSSWRVIVKMSFLLKQTMQSPGLMLLNDTAYTYKKIHTNSSIKVTSHMHMQGYTTKVGLCGNYELKND